MVSTALAVPNSSWQNSLPTEKRVVKSSKQKPQSWRELAKKYAGIVDSRESISRIFLEFFGGDIPWILSAALRNKQSMFEAMFECSLSLVSFVIAPFLTEKIAKLGSKFILDKDERPDALNLIQFFRKELKDKNSFEKGRARILAEEPLDKERIAGLYESMDKSDKAVNYRDKANQMRTFFNKLEHSDSLRNKIEKLKEFTITGESAIEGFLWGSVGLLIRWFRANVLKQGRFTGTKKYLNDKDAKKIGEDKPLAWWQKLGGGSMAVFSPIMNNILMKKFRDPNFGKGNSFLEKINKSLDMTHGIFPKLGLMFSYTSLPKWIGRFITSQGRDELLENLLKFVVLMSSWWQGHKLFNGAMSKFFDNKLAEKYNVDKGILVDKEYLDKTFVEPARIHQLLDRTKGNEALEEEAKDLHSKILYGGLTLHSLFIFAMCIGVNLFTKWRVEHKKAKLEGAKA